MNLALSDGRTTPDEELDDWGFDGPTLHGVYSVVQRYRTRTTVKFVSKAATEVARLLTGWRRWDDDVLEIQWQDDLIEIVEPDGRRRYFADIVFDYGLPHEEIKRLEARLSEARDHLECAKGCLG